MRKYLLVCVSMLYTTAAIPEEQWWSKNWTNSCYHRDNCSTYVEPRYVTRYIKKYINRSRYIYDRIDENRDHKHRGDHQRDNYRHGDVRQYCKDTLRVVGTQHLTVDGAKKSADNHWAGTVRFHYGEKYMTLDRAYRVSYTCSRSSIEEAGLSTLGQIFTRCEIEAQPCAAERQ